MAGKETQPLTDNSIDKSTNREKIKIYVLKLGTYLERINNNPVITLQEVTADKLADKKIKGYSAYRLRERVLVKSARIGSKNFFYLTKDTIIGASSSSKNFKPKKLDSKG